MTVDALGIIGKGMTELGLEYDFGTYKKKPVVYPYFVGEYQEFESTTEDGKQELTFMLNGFSRSDWLTLVEAKEKIENYFNRIWGKTVITENGSAVAVFFSDSLIVPTGDMELKRIQINLKVMEWKVY